MAPVSGIDDLEAHLRRIGRKMPRAVESALAEGAEVLLDKLIPRAMAASVPPVDMEGEYADGWDSTRTKGGAVVGNTSPLSVDLEQGRVPGPIDIEDVRREVANRRLFAGERAEMLAASGKKRLGRGERRSLIETMAWAIKKARERDGIVPRWVLRRAVAALGAEMPALLKKHVEALK